MSLNPYTLRNLQGLIDERIDDIRADLGLIQCQLASSQSDVDLKVNEKEATVNLKKFMII